MLLLTYAALILGFAVVFLLAFCAFKHLGRGWTFKLLFKDFKRKIWMTLSLGGLFFSLYTLVVWLGMSFAQQLGPDLFFLVYRHPVDFIYGGLCVFACVSLSIYLARMIIKYLFLTKGKDS